MNYSDDTHVSLNPSSGGSAGSVTITDMKSTSTQIRGAAYWNRTRHDSNLATHDADLSARALVQRGAVEDFVAQQQVVDGANTSGILAFIIGSNGLDTTPRLMKLTAGRVTVT